MFRVRQLKLLLLVFGSVFLSVTPVHAEDIEIYLTSNEGAGANILLLIDTSAATHRNFGSGAVSEGGKTIDEIVYALKKVANGLAGSTRIGVASQLSGGTNGGAINYPVLQIDERTPPLTVSRVMQPTADASQAVTVMSLPAGTTDPAVVWGGFDGSTVLSLPSSLATAEAESVLAIMLSDLEVPRYAKILQATLEVKSPSPNSGPANNFNLRIAHERIDAPAPYTASTDLSARTWSLPFDTGSASYNASGGLNAGKLTLNVTNVIQSAVQDTVWCGGNDLSLLIQATSLNATAVPQIYSYRAESADETRLGSMELTVRWSETERVSPPATATGDAALSCMNDVIFSLKDMQDDGVETTSGGNLTTDKNTLNIENVTTGPASVRGDHVAGLRFRDVGIPQNAKISNAMLRGSFVSVGGTTLPKLIVRPMLGNVEFFDSPGSISSVSLGAQSVEVAAAAGPFEANVTSVIQEILSDGTWVLGGTLGLRLERNAGFLSLHALDGGAASAATLELDVLTADPRVFAEISSRRNEMRVAVEKLSDSQGGGNNKPVSAYTEAARYMLSGTPKYGTSVSHIGAFSSSDRTDYYAPWEAYDQCGGNHIVMITHADSNGEAFEADVDGLIGADECPSDANADAWTCAGALASYLADSTRNPTGFPITTHAISFAADDGLEAVLEDVAVTKGGGTYLTAETADDLIGVLEDLINRITTTDASMAAPGVAVNQLNRFRHLDQLYYALFRPDEYTRWEGNLKRYRIDFTSNPPAIVDEKGNPAVDAETGFFKETSNSWWGLRADNTDPDDGQKVNEGGALEELLKGRAADDPRRVWTVTSSPAPSGGALGMGAPAGAVAEELPVTVVAGTEVEMGARLGVPATITAADEIQQRLNLARDHWGDPLHSEPRLVNFGFEGTFEQAVLDDSRQKNVAFITTNGGALHAVEPDTGYELFTFIPPEELLKTEARFQNEQLDGSDPQRTTYGLDGGITVWRKAASDGSGQPAHVFLYMGQRRGGRAYYALDVSDMQTSKAELDAAGTPTPPTLLWKIQGGVAPFEKLGQTWSQPTLAQIKVNGQKVPVLVFGGGYSAADHDTAGSVSSGDAMGNAIYIVNAYTGELIWSASNSGATATNADMKWSIPGSVSVIDINFDGVIDYLYAADLGGQIFRVDLDANNTGAASLAARVVTLAKLGTSVSLGDIADHRRFFAPPVVALSRRGDEVLFQVAIGSGYRAHPLNTQTQDRIYVIDDVDALHAFEDGYQFRTAPILEADLLDVTTNMSPTAAEFDGKSGWFLNLGSSATTDPNDDGEKVLAAAAIADGILYMTSFLPQTSYANECQRVIGASLLYGVNILDGSPALDMNNTGTLTRTAQIRLPGLPPSPQLLLGEGGERVILIGTAAVDQEDPGNLNIRKTRWYEVPDKATADAVLNEAMQGQ